MARSAGRQVALGCGLPVVLVVAVVVAGLAYVRLTERSDRDHPAATAPADLCAVVGEQTVARFVPFPERESEGVYSSTTPANGDAGCAWSSGGARTGESYALLRVRVLRHGQIANKSGVDRASEAYDDVCKDPGGAGVGGTVTGLGDEACVAEDDPDSDRTASAYLRVRRGADLFWVDYSLHPGTARDVRDRATELARRMLAGV